MYIHVGEYLFRNADVRLIDIDPRTKALTITLAGAMDGMGDSCTVVLKGPDYETFRAWTLGQITGLVRDVPGLGPVRDLDPPGVEESAR